MLSHKIPERTQVTGLEDADDLRDLLTDHDVDFSLWGTEAQPKSNDSEKLWKNLQSGGYTLWIVEGGSLMRECDTMRAWVTMETDEGLFVLREAHKQKAGAGLKRKWDIESTLGERRQFIGDSDELEANGELIERGLKEELGLSAVAPHLYPAELTPEGLHIVRESPSFPGLNNVFRFTDVRARIGEREPGIDEDFYDTDTVTEIVDEEGGTVVGWAWGRVPSAEELHDLVWRQSLEMMNVGDNPEDFSHPDLILPVSFLKRAFRDERARRGSGKPRYRRSGVQQAGSFGGSDMTAKEAIVEAFTERFF